MTNFLPYCRTKTFLRRPDPDLDPALPVRSATNHWVARLGAYRRGSTLLSPFESLHQVSHIIVHPDYEDVGYVHDIALLRLADSVRWVEPVVGSQARRDRHGNSGVNEDEERQTGWIDII